jgi:hypothetical protein
MDRDSAGDVHEVTTDADGRQRVTVHKCHHAITFPAPGSGQDERESDEGALSMLRRMGSFGGE